MILSRRQAHFYSFVILAVLIPICFVAGIWLRPSYNAVGESATELFYQAGFVRETPANKAITTAKLSDATFWAQAKTFLTPEGEILLQLQPNSNLQFPDPLLYWEAGEKQPTKLSDTSLLLGDLAGPFQRHFLVPKAMQGQAGHLLIYSPIQQEVVATLPLPAKLTKPRRK